MAHPTEAGRSAKDKRVVIYDPSAHNLSVIKVEEIQGMSKYSSRTGALAERSTTALGTKPIEEYTLPKLRNNFDIMMEESPSTRKTLVAKVDLSHLGLFYNMQRRCGRITKLYVMELPNRR